MNLFSDGAWSNGCYELLIDVGGGDPAPERVVEVSVALWSLPDLDGTVPADRRLDLSLPTDTGLRRFHRTRWA